MLQRAQMKEMNKVQNKYPLNLVIEDSGDKSNEPG